MNEPRTARPSMSRRDAVRIVPLRPAEDTGLIGAVAPTAAAGLTFHGGPLLSNVEVVTVFWGSDWSAGNGKVLADELNAFFDTILVSSLMDQLAEYGTSEVQIGRGRRTYSTSIPSPEPGAVVTDADIRGLLDDRIAAGALPQPTPNSLYFVFLPSGVTVDQGGSRSCHVFCGYHDDVGGTLFYAVMPFPSCDGCMGSLPVLDALTSTTSHEVCEAITDPVPGQGWYDDANQAEIGDLCAWRTKVVAGATVQQEWSNRANACV